MIELKRNVVNVRKTGHNSAVKLVFIVENNQVKIKAISRRSRS